MKKAVLSFTLIFTVFAFFAQTEVKAAPVSIGGAELTIDKDFHDYGTIEQGASGACEFLVTNTGTEPLLLTRCKGSCGCTVPKCAPEPIAPGASTIIKVNYDTKRIGPINKSVTIESNASNAKVKIVKIKGTVIKPPSGSPELSPAGPTAK
ncbi:MAG: hypothetical protein ACI9J3_000281 [Parvicellaceae bacterium]|jgi:hypothetical protein